MPTNPVILRFIAGVIPLIALGFINYRRCDIEVYMGCVVDIRKN
jgi:hypothetical protein